MKNEKSDSATISAADAGWRSARGDASLLESFASIRQPEGASLLRRSFAFMGPAFLVAVGYMDPGNWATSISGGAKFGYGLLSVVLLSSLIAILLQTLSARLGIASGRDLAQACRDAFPKPVAFVLWILAEIAIIATDIAEVVGTAIGLQLLFGIPIAWGVIITALDVFLILALQRYGFRYIEVFVISLLAIIFVCFGLQIFWAEVAWEKALPAFVPQSEILTNPNMLYLALGIIGATIMPHNLFLHSAVVQTRYIGNSAAEKRSALKFATIDTVLALSFAFLVNASILILAAASFHQAGYFDLSEIGDAHSLLAPLLGSALAPKLFGIALLCCGLNSTITATLSGQVVMEGFLRLRLPPAFRRLITRGIAIIPAATVVVIYGDSGTGMLLVLSQVILALQLPFAIVPLILFTASKTKMQGLQTGLVVLLLSSLAALVIIALNIKFLSDYFGS